MTFHSIGTTVRIALLALLVASGCGGTVTNPADGGGDGAMLDGGLPDGQLIDGTPAFDAATTYAGEGDACRFSVDCGLRQICVDDACVRHERLSVDALEHGEWRGMTDAELDASPMYTKAVRPWSDLQSNYMQSDDMGSQYGPTSWMVPGLDGPELLTLGWHPNRCQLLTVGKDVRVVSIPGTACFSATANEAGYIAIAGAVNSDGSNQVALFDRSGELLWMKPIPASVHQRVALAGNWGTNAQAGIITALYFHGGKLYAAASRGSSTLVTTRPWLTNTPYGAGSYGLVFLEIDLAGNMQVFPVQGKDVHDGTKGWLVEKAGKLGAVISRQTGTDIHDVEMGALDFETGNWTQIVATYGHDGGYFQPTHESFVATSHVNGKHCTATVLDLDGSVWTNWWSDTDLCAAYDGALSARSWYLGVQNPWGIAFQYAGHPMFTFARMGASLSGTTVLGFSKTTSSVEAPYFQPDWIGSGGTGAVSRFGKALEFAYVQDRDAHFLRWAEWTLKRRVP